MSLYVRAWQGEAYSSSSSSSSSSSLSSSPPLLHGLPLRPRDRESLASSDGIRLSCSKGEWASSPASSSSSPSKPTTSRVCDWFLFWRIRVIMEVKGRKKESKESSGTRTTSQQHREFFIDSKHKEGRQNNANTTSTRTLKEQFKSTLKQCSHACLCIESVIS